MLSHSGTVLSEYLAFEALSERANGTECMHESARVICEKREKIGQIEATLNLLCKGDPHENTILWTCKLTPYVRRVQTCTNSVYFQPRGGVKKVTTIANLEPSCPTTFDTTILSLPPTMAQH